MLRRKKVGKKKKTERKGKEKRYADRAVEERVVMMLRNEGRK